MQTQLASASTSAEVTAITTQLTAAQTALANAIAANGTASDTNATNIEALQTSLEAVQATLAELKTALDSASTSADVEALTAALATVQSDLADLLAANNVYSDNLIINSSATLAVAKSLGGKLAIINADVTITQSSAMSAADLQEVLDVIVTVTGDISYTMVSNASTQGVFNNLTSVGDLTLDVAGSINLPLLENAGAIKLGTTHKNYVTAIEMPVLSSVASFKTDTAVDTIDFSKATAVTLTALANYDGATPASSKLKIAGKLDFTLDLAALTSKTAAGAKNPITLTIEGAKEVTLPLFTEGSVIANTSEKIVLATFEGGASDSFSKAEYLHLQAYERSLVAAQISSNLETLIFNGVAPATATTAAGNPSLNVTGASGLTTLTVSGKLNDVTMSGNTSLTDVTFSGSANDVVLSGATSLETAVLAHTGAAITTAESSLTVTGNTELTSLTVDALVNAGKLLITGNTSLETLSFAKLAGIGVAKVPMVDISNNNLTATSVDYTAAGTTAAAIAAGGTGSIVSESGLSTLKTYLGKAATASTAAASYTYVAFDTVDKFINLSDEESGPFTYTVSNGKGLAANANLEVINVSPAAGAEGAVAAVRSIEVSTGVTVTVGTTALPVTSFSQGVGGVANGIADLNGKLDNSASGAVSIRTKLTNGGHSVSAVGTAAVGTLTIPDTGTSLASIAITAGTRAASDGSEATAVLVAVSAPDLAGGIQATATATVAAGVINAVTVTNGGSGYTSAPTFTYTWTGLAPTSAALVGTLSSGRKGTNNSLTIGDEVKVTVGAKSIEYTIAFDNATATGSNRTILGLSSTDLPTIDATGTASETYQGFSSVEIAKIIAKLIDNADHSKFSASTGTFSPTTTSATSYDTGEYTSVASGSTDGIITITSNRLGSSDIEKNLKLELETATATSTANTIATTSLGTFGNANGLVGKMNFTKMLIKATALNTGVDNSFVITASGATYDILVPADLKGSDGKVYSEAVRDYLDDNSVTYTAFTAATIFPSDDNDNFPRADYVFAEDAVTASTAASTTNKVSWL